MKERIDLLLHEPLSILRRYHRGPRSSFSLPVDSYFGWVVLAPSTGGFEYRLSRNSSAPATWDWVASGDLVVCPPGMHLHRRMKESIVFHFLELGWLRPDHPSFNRAINLLAGRISPEDPWRVLSSLILLSKLVDSGAADANEYSIHLARDILYQCVWNRVATENRTLPDPRVESVAEAIRTRFAEPLQLSELAREAAMSPSQLTRRFRRAYGATPVRRLTRVRVQEAARLLTSGVATLDTIAEACGFANGFYLSRVFTKEMGVPPSVYRREHSV